MNRKWMLRLAICVMVLALLAACNAPQLALPTATTAPTATPEPTAIPQLPATVESILAQSAEAMKQVQSMQFTYTTTVEAAGQTIKTDGQGMFKKPDQMYMKLNAMGQTIEMVMLEPGKVYLKMPGSDKFTLSTPGTAGQEPVAPDIMAQTNIADFASGLTLDGEETLDGVPTYVISYSMDIGKYLKSDPSSAAIFDPAKTTGDGKVWIDKETGRMLKMEMNLGMELAGNKIGTVTEMSFTNFNEPVEIPQP